MLIAIQFQLVDPARQQGKVESRGAPISDRFQSLVGMVFHPQAIIVTEHHILIYDKNEMVYVLDGIHLDGVSPEQLPVATNSTYTVYMKGDRKLFGKL